MKRELRIFSLSMLFSVLMVSGAFAQYDNLYFELEETEPSTFEHTQQYDTRRASDYSADRMSYADRITRFHRGRVSGRGYYNPYEEVSYNNVYRSYDAYNPYGYSDRVIIHVGSPAYNYRYWNRRYNPWNNCRVGYGYADWASYGYGYRFDPFWGNYGYGYSPYFNDRRYYPRYYNNRNWNNHRNNPRTHRKTKRQKYIERNGRGSGSRYGNNRNRGSRNGNGYKSSSTSTSVRSYSTPRKSSSNSRATSRSQKQPTRKHNGRKGRG